MADFKKNIAIIFILLICLLCHETLEAQCLGSLDLCNKRYNEVSFVMTHNAYNYDSDFTLPNQTHPIAKQLEDGVRGFMIDVYLLNGEATVYHGFSGLGNQSFTNNLKDIAAFLDTHPNEIITLIIESYVSSATIDSALQVADLKLYLHIQKTDEDWPTLQEMIDNNQRLVIFSESDNADGLDWHHYVWDFMVETHYSNQSTEDLSCDYNRGNPENALFLLNHFITAPVVGTGELDSAALINDNPFFIDRCMECWEVTGKMPNFIAVDFYEQGKVFDTANMLNGILTSVKNVNAQMPELTLYYQNERITIEIKQTILPKLQLYVYDVLGRATEVPHYWQANRLVIETKAFLPGLYFYKIKGKELIFKGKIWVQ